MSVTSLAFAGFVLVVLILYYLLPRRAQNNLLLAASYVFLATWDIRFVVVFALLTLVNFALARRIAQQGKTGYTVYAGIAFNVAVLLYFKYTGFFITQAANLAHTLDLPLNTDSIAIWLPVGLSFFVVQEISYLLDVYQGITQPPTDPLHFALYMVYFPRMVSGPIERARDLMPQFEQKRIVDSAQIDTSAALILQGLVRKIVIADLLFISMPTNIFDQPRSYTAPELALWLVAYAVALYNDFAGYTLIVRGVSGLFGIRLVSNFDAPYFAHNFNEFWQRWHISLSNWLRDYSFLPLTRALLRRKHIVLALLLPPLVTMFVSAMWHNLSWNMMLWGALHGCYLVIERLYSRHRPQTMKSRSMASMLIVFGLVALTWVPFRASLSATADYWIGLFSPVSWLDGLTINSVTMATTVLIGLSFVIDSLHMRIHVVSSIFRKRSKFAKAILIDAALIAVILATILQQGSVPPFVYQGF
ncbi:MBOAT family O-acyltransferase [Aggregatilinea lenta]|uniref:MBOAT family O-acyltransferase n=1 Tax=Aggregatilinea lenta TaxID=913108 RepID=UPI000E5AC2F3|nr:MBOAT family O-acyltransferase [Aggregatilinea lenta]